MKKSRILFLILLMGAFISGCSGCDGVKTSLKIESAKCGSSTATPNVAKAVKPVFKPVAKPVVAKPVVVPINEVILFNFNKATIRTNQQSNIDTIASLMKQYPDIKINITGYASKEGQKLYNLQLSKYRANAVKAALVTKGVAPDRIIVVIGKGATTQFSKLLSPNRRVVVSTVK